MLTRLEVDGFKNLLNFTLDFGPVTCIAGLNGVGKSNIFDAIKLLSLLTNNDIHSAASLVRENQEFGDINDIFFTDGEDRHDRIKIAAEMIVPEDVTDDFGRKASVKSTYLRYEIELRLGIDEYGNNKIEIIHEYLKHILKNDATEKLKFPLSASKFRDKVVVNRRKGTAFISTNTADDGIVEIHIHQDGGSSGQTKKIPARLAPRSVIANTNSIELPTILAAKREMESWMFIALEPSSMRRSNSFRDPRKISSNGDYLASTLHKIFKKDSSALDRIIRKMNNITKVSDIKIDEDLKRDIFTLQVKEQSGAFIPARGLSDGTLRFLTLSIISEDAEFTGLLCFEEPENGIHPAKLSAMLELLREISVDSDDEVSEVNPLRQMVIATHSPIMVQLQDINDLVLADVVKVKGPFGRPANTIRCKPIFKSWRSNKLDAGCSTVSISSIMTYLKVPEGAQISMDIFWGEE
ncbi:MULTISPECIES: AAA family ATPase [unclassified Shewanella]|uniref:AAA family ATPase n=1 Tax=unclassified Shewanella TaxID=196818 RepID=UPI0039B454C7